MTINEMEQFIKDNQNRICCSDIYYLQYQQAKAAYDAMQNDIGEGSPTAGTDLMILTIGHKCYPVGCFNADATEALSQALCDIMEMAIGDIHLAKPDQIV